MKRGSILATVIGSTLLMGGAMYKAPRVTANPSLLYLAGQAKMALGDTTGGLQLLSKAARQREAEQITVPQATPKQTVQVSKACSERTVLKAQQPVVLAKAEPKKSEKKFVMVKAAAKALQPKVLMAKVEFPADPFNGQQEVPGMTREEVARVTAAYQQQVHRWTERQAARPFEFAKFDRKAGRARHAEFIRVMVPEATGVERFPPEPPRTTP